ncbi:MAG: trehalose-phosphatase, partial [Calditrichaceae bacterium]
MNTNEENNKTKESIEAVILDLDGVITETSKIHAKSWKKMFDEYNQKLTESGKQKFKPFSIEEDYYEYINGKPRYDGVRSFLKSRNIELPEGDPGDKPGENTVCGLGNHKNELFQKLLTEEGVTVYNDTVEKIKEWRNHGIKTAVVSSSKNCKKIVEMTGLSELFDVRVDGIILAELNLNGKPAPDTFLHAAKELNVPPSRAAVVEDAISGVQAGKSGRFKLVIGVARSGTANELLENGADIVVRTMAELRTLDKWNTPRIDPSHLADALQYGTEIEEQIKIKRLVVFLDYDGTLTPIVSRPEDAFLSADMRAVLENLASLCTVVIISGRDLKDVQNLVNIHGLIYAGSHGFDISASGAINLTHQ